MLVPGARPLSPVNQHGELGKQDRPAGTGMHAARTGKDFEMCRPDPVVRAMRRPRQSGIRQQTTSRRHRRQQQARARNACMLTMNASSKHAGRSGPVTRRPDATAVPVVGPTYGPGQHVSARPPFFTVSVPTCGGRRENSPACVCSACTDGCM